MKSIKMQLAIIFAALTVAPLAYGADEAKSAGVYAGVQTAGSFGACTFRSVSSGIFNSNIDGGFFVGYRFNKVFSFQVEAVAGQLMMESLDCCDDYILLYRQKLDGNYTLEKDYFLKDRTTGLLGVPRWQYRDLTSYVNFQRYELQASLNLIGLLKKNSRLSLNVSPVVSAVRTNSRISGRLMDYDENLNKVLGDRCIAKTGAKWHFGYGYEAALGWDCTDEITVQAFGGNTYLLGSRIDGMPQSINLGTGKVDHFENLIWEAGLKYIYRF